MYLFSQHGTPAVFSQFLTSQFLCPAAPFPNKISNSINWLGFLHLIVPFSYVSAAYQVGLVEFVFWQDVVKQK